MYAASLEKEGQYVEYLLGAVTITALQWLYDGRCGDEVITVVTANFMLRVRLHKSQCCEGTTLVLALA